MKIYQTALAEALSSSSSQPLSLQEANGLAAQALLTHTAKEVIKAMTQVLALPPRMPRHLREVVYEWLGGWWGGGMEEERRR